MKTTLILVNRTDDQFARFLLPNGSTIGFTEPSKASDALKVYFGMNELGIEAYFKMDSDKSWEHTEYNPSFHHTEN